MSSTVRTCGDCRAPLRAKHNSRGRCRPCLYRHQRAGTHLDLPTLVRPRRDLIDDYLLLRGEGHTRRQIAARLGIRRNSLDRAIQRAGQAGDTRVDYQPRTRPPVDTKGTTA